MKSEVTVDELVSELDVNRIEEFALGFLESNLEDGDVIRSLLNADQSLEVTDELLAAVTQKVIAAQEVRRKAHQFVLSLRLGQRQTLPVQTAKGGHLRP